MMKKFKKGQRVLVEAVIDVDERSYVSKNTERVYFVNTFCGNGHLTMVTEDKIRPMTEKVKIPQFVADKIEYCKSASGYGLFHAMDHCFNFEYLADWLESNEDIFARAWLDGYEVEQEKLYTVEIPNPNGVFSTVLMRNSDEEIVLSKCFSPDFLEKKTRYQLTESEIRKDFEWAWQAGFAKEVEEVI